MPVSGLPAASRSSGFDPVVRGCFAEVQKGRRSSDDRLVDLGILTLILESIFVEFAAQERAQDAESG